MVAIPSCAGRQLLRTLATRHANLASPSRLWSAPKCCFSAKQSIQVIAHRLDDVKHRNPMVYSAGTDAWSIVHAPNVSMQASNNAGTMQSIQDNIKHFLPANYPASVAHGYAKFASYCFVASVAGSAGMVLSTQTLLLAVGVVGSTGQASILAGAINWVIKDGVGQLGGVLFASRMSQSHRFDASPKRWRMVAALSLDAATVLEIASPLVSDFWVLPLASVANIGKNIGFLTASASRAALHQSLALKQNLADVTAKSGSQSIAASLVGTTLGIGLSPILGDVTHFALGFVCLSVIHLGCNYLSLKSIPLCRFDRHRLHLVLKCYVETNKVLTPEQVAKQEVFFPGMNSDDTHLWLSVGSPISLVCPKGPIELGHLQRTLINEKYLVNVVNEMVHLVYFYDASGDDLIRGMLHAHLLHYNESTSLAVPCDDIIDVKYQELQHCWGQLKANLEESRWRLEGDGTCVEDSSAYRIQIYKT